MSSSTRRSQSPGGARLSSNSPPDTKPSSSQIEDPSFHTPTPHSHTHSHAYSTMEPIHTPTTRAPSGQFDNNSGQNNMMQMQMQMQAFSNMASPPSMPHVSSSNGPSSNHQQHNLNPLAKRIHEIIQETHQRLMQMQTALNRASGQQVSQIGRAMDADLKEMGLSMVNVSKIAWDLSAETLNLRQSIMELQKTLSPLLDLEQRMKALQADNAKLTEIVERMRFQVGQSESEASWERERSKDCMAKMEVEKKRADELAAVAAEMRDRMNIMREQLDGKRSLWFKAKHNEAAQNLAIETIFQENPDYARAIVAENPNLALPALPNIPARPSTPGYRRVSSPATTRPSTSYDSSRSSSYGWGQAFLPPPPQPVFSKSANISLEDSWASLNQTTQMNTNFNSGRVSSMNANAAPFQYQPPHPPMRPQSTMPLTMQQNRQVSSYTPGGTSLRPAQAPHFAPGPFGDPSPSRALVPLGQQQPEDAETSHWAQSFEKIWDAIGRWIEESVAPAYVSILEKCQNSRALWEYMLAVTYPDKPQEAASHAAFLLQSDVTRRAFVKRLMVQHTTKSIFVPELWFGFSPDVDKRIQETIDALARTEQFRNIDRQNILDQQALIVQGIMSSKFFNEFRQKKTNLLTAQFKQILIPVLAPDVNRDKAARGLNDLSWLIFEQACKMATSGLHFGYVWNETCSKFSHESHVALNAQGMDGMTLQLRQYRLMVVMTPGITTREDRGLNIVPKRLLKSTVLIMT